MLGELRADQRFRIPGPVVFRIAAGAVNPDKGSAVLEPRLERGALRLSVRVAARVVPHRHFEPLELIGIEDRRVLRHERGPAALLRDGQERRVGRLDGRTVSIPVRLRKDQEPAALQILRQLGRRRVHHRRDEPRESAPPGRLWRAAAERPTWPTRRGTEREGRRRTSACMSSWDALWPSHAGFETA